MSFEGACCRWKHHLVVLVWLVFLHDVRLRQVVRLVVFGVGLFLDHIWCGVSHHKSPMLLFRH